MMTLFSARSSFAHLRTTHYIGELVTSPSQCAEKSVTNNIIIMWQRVSRWSSGVMLTRIVRGRGSTPRCAYTPYLCIHIIPVHSYLICGFINCAFVLYMHWYLISLFITYLCVHTLSVYLYPSVYSYPICASIHYLWVHTLFVNSYPFCVFTHYLCIHTLSMHSYPICVFIISVHSYPSYLSIP